MEAGKKYSQSSITINFGDKVQDPTPFKLNFDIHLVSEKNENLRFNVAQYIGTEVPENSLLFEIQAKGDGQTLAQKIKEIAETSNSIKKMKDKDVKFNVVGKGNKVYIILIGNGLQQQFQALTSLKEQLPLEKGLDQILSIQIKSNNRLEKVKQILVSQQKTRAFLDSLKFLIRFKRTEQTNVLLQAFLSQALMHSPTSPASLLNSFDNFNLSVKCESSKFLQNNQAYLKLLENLPKTKFNEEFEKIRNLIGNQVQNIVKQIKFNFFNSGVSASALLVAEDLHFMLDLIFA